MHHRIAILASTSLILFALTFIFGCQPKQPVYTPEDEAAVRGLCQQYAAAWLAGDAGGVLALYAPDAVLIPHHGEEPVTGKENIRLFWFNPDYPPTRVLKMENTIVEADGSGGMAFVRGVGYLEYEFQNQRYSNRGNFVQIFKRGPDGWKIFRHIWNDPLAPVLAD
jgi:ketosteroid isomerase-like protein